MPEISELVLSMVKPLVEFPDDVRIDISESDEFMEYTLRVNPQDIGRVPQLDGLENLNLELDRGRIKVNAYQENINPRNLRTR